MNLIDWWVHGVQAIAIALPCCQKLAMDILLIAIVALSAVALLAYFYMWSARRRLDRIAQSRRTIDLSERIRK